MDWLYSNVEGFIDRRHARKCAALMLKHGFVRHTVNKITFSEQCYYIFGDFKQAAQSLSSGNDTLLYWCTNNNFVFSEYMCLGLNLCLTCFRLDKHNFIGAIFKISVES